MTSVVKKSIISLKETQSAEALFSVLLRLVEEGAPEPVFVRPKVHHFVILDCSGSMYGAINTMKKHLKTKLADLVKNGDTITICWFSGKNQFGVLMEYAKLDDAQEIKALFKAIDDEIYARGLTCFIDVLRKVHELAVAISEKEPDSVQSMMFHTDGYDNCSEKADIYAICEELGKVLTASCVVEHGYYCDHALLEQMTARIGAALVFSENADQFVDTFEKYLKAEMAGSSVVNLEITHDDVSRVVGFYNGNLTVWSPKDGIVRIPEKVSSVSYVTKNSAGATAKPKAQSSITRYHLHLYLLLAAESKAKNVDAVWQLLRVIGDVSLIKKFENCFSKQDYNRFIDSVILAYVDHSHRFTDGFDQDAIPDANAPFVVELIRMLDDADAILYPHLIPNYSRITDKMVDASDILFKDRYPVVIDRIKELAGKNSLSLEEEQELANLTQEKKNLNSIKDVKFTITNREAGSELRSVVWNSERPNISLGITYHGTVTIPSNGFGIPSVLPSKIFRNYTVVRDGIVHTPILPISIPTQEAFDKINARFGSVIKALSVGWIKDHIYMIDISELPVLNRNQVISVDSDTFMTAVCEAAIFSAHVKYTKDYFNKFHGGRRNYGYEAEYGADAAAWLKSIGIDDQNGYAPRSSISIAKEDKFIVKSFLTKIASLSSLPSVNKYETDLASKKDPEKLTLGSRLMHEAKLSLDAFKASIPKEYRINEVHAALESHLKSLIAHKRTLDRALSIMKFSMVVGHSWLSDIPADQDVIEHTHPMLPKVKFKATLVLDESEEK